MHFFLTIFLLFPVALASSEANKTGKIVSDEKIHWVTIDNSQGSVGFTVPPAGREGNLNLYLCRVYHRGHWVPGTLYKNSEGAFASIVEDGEQHWNSREFEVLSSPDETTSWVPAGEKYLPGNAIIGGNHPNGEIAYICRAFHGRDLIIGKYSQNVGRCYYGFDGHEHEAIEFEILIVNGYGKAIGVQL